MNKEQFVEYISQEHNCTKAEADRIINIFTNSVISAMGSGNDITLIGFGSFNLRKVAAREGRNPKNGEVIKIAARIQGSFKVGKKLKDACNSSSSGKSSTGK